MPQTSSRPGTSAKDGGGAVSRSDGGRWRGQDEETAELVAWRNEEPAVPKSPARQRSPVFDIPRAEVMRRSQKWAHCQLCGGEVLALRDVMEMFGWSIERLSDCSGVSRAMISGILQVKKFPTSVIRSALVTCMGLTLYEFDLIVAWELEEMLPDR